MTTATATTTTETATTLSDTDLKLAIWTAIEKWEDKFFDVFGIRVGAKIVFKLRGRSCAGTACYATTELDFNLDCARVNLDDFLATTIPHEMAHLASVEIFGYNRGRGHGVCWKRVMRSIGVTPNRTTSAYQNAPRARKVKRHVYILSCGCSFDLTTHKHKITQNCTTSNHPYYSCNKHGTKIEADDFYQSKVLV